MDLANRDDHFARLKFRVDHKFTLVGLRLLQDLPLVIGEFDLQRQVIHRIHDRLHTSSKKTSIMCHAGTGLSIRKRRNTSPSTKKNSPDQGRISEPAPGFSSATGILTGGEAK
jgi:hypothetical protein